MSSSSSEVYSSSGEEQEDESGVDELPLGETSSSLDARLVRSDESERPPQNSVAIAVFNFLRTHPSTLVAKLWVQRDAHVRRERLYGISALLAPRADVALVAKLVASYEDLTAASAVYTLESSSYDAERIRELLAERQADTSVPFGYVHLDQEDYEFGDETSRIVLGQRKTCQGKSSRLVVHSYARSSADELRKAVLAARTLDEIVEKFAEAHRRAQQARNKLALALANWLKFSLQVVMVVEGGKPVETAREDFSVATTSLVRLDEGYVFNAGVAASRPDAKRRGESETSVFLMRPIDGFVLVTHRAGSTQHLPHGVAPLAAPASIGEKISRASREDLARTAERVFTTGGAFRQHPFADPLYFEPTQATKSGRLSALERRLRRLGQDTDAEVDDYVPVFTLLGSVDSLAQPIERYLEAAADAKTFALPREHEFLLEIVPRYFPYAEAFGRDAKTLSKIFSGEDRESGVFVFERAFVRDLLDTTSQ